MKKVGLFAILIVSGAVWAAAEVTPLNLSLQPAFDSDFECAWQAGPGQTVWVAPVQDDRAEKEVGLLVIKQEETPLYSARPVTELFEEVLEKGLKKCGYALASGEGNADLVLQGVLKVFSGVSKKGLLKGKAEGEAELILRVKRPADHAQISVTLTRGETRAKGVSRKPKKLEKILNNLLTQLALDVFESRQVAEWLKP